MKLIGLFGGTFNPVHLGHLHVAHHVLITTPVELVHFLPCYQPVHRTAPAVSPEQRLAMLELALADQPQMSIDTHELDRQGPSYMIDTLRVIHAEAPEQRRALILGFDAFAGLPQWKEWKQLADYCHFIVVNRPQSAAFSGQLADWVAPRQCQSSEQLLSASTGLVYQLTIPPNEISASRLRVDLAAGKDVSDQLPHPVLAYIRKNMLYLKQNSPKSK